MMSRDERLKKRIAAPRKSKNEIYLSGHRTNSFHITEGPRAGISHIQALTTKARNRQRSKGSKYENLISFNSLKRAARAFVSRNEMITRCAVSTTLKLMTFLFCLVIASFVFFENDKDISNARDLGNLRKQVRKVKRSTMAEFEIFFSKEISGNFSTLFEIDAIEMGLERYQDYGGLEIRYVGRKRQISDFDYLSESGFRHPEKSRDDDGNDAYLAFDDDYLRGTEGTLSENSSGKICHRSNTHRHNFQNCNTIFETELLNNHVKYLNAGSYRQVFSLQHLMLQHYESIVVKDMYAGNDFAAGDYEFVRMDAMVAERLTSSPRIYDIYGFCGLSILSEFFPHGDIENKAVTGSGYLLTDKEQQKQKSDLNSYNDLSSEQKLVMSLQMAEAVADLHGDSFGVIVHQDIQLSQFLVNSDSTVVKLNDFNRAEFMLWDDKKKEYCKYNEGEGNGNWRSPEEYFDHDLNQQVDVFSLGNNMYSLLTGLWIFYDEDDSEKVKKRVKAGQKPYIDPRYKERSLAEAKLADIIDKCHSYYPEDRPSVFEIVKILRDALKEIRGSEHQKK